MPHGSRRIASFETLEARTLFSAVPISTPPAFNSLPGAPAAIYLDFNGDSATGYGPFSRDSDLTTFSDTDQADIKKIWEYVAEKFSPFNINVTTVKPTVPESHILISNDYAGVGVGAVGAFPNTAVEGKVNGTMSDTEIGLAATHETGHTMGLYHQALYDSNGNLVDEYRPGNGSYGPIMGDPGSSRAVWAIGTRYPGSATTIQDDLAVIAGDHHGVTFGYRPDDHGNSRSTADALKISGTTATQSGIITKVTDKDYFSFTTGAGTVSLTASVPAIGAMLDLSLQLLDSAGNVLKTIDTTSLGETLSMKVAAGKFYLVVLSNGHYGDIGSYAFKGTIIKPAAAAVVAKSSALTIDNLAAAPVNASDTTTPLGIITKITDKDSFPFTTSTRTVSLVASMPAINATPDLSLQLLNCLGEALNSIDTISLGETLSM